MVYSCKNRGGVHLWECMHRISGIPFTKNAKGPDDLEMLVISETSSMNIGKYT